MIPKLSRTEHIALGRNTIKWVLLGTLAGMSSGAASALFLFLLDRATSFRTSHPAMLWLLPLAGIAISAVYDRFGKDVEGGNNLLLEGIHDPNTSIPFRMVPLVLLTTILTHLCGGSAGREGTAVQMGGTLAGMSDRCLKLNLHDRRFMIMSGISGGFGAVFGTPLAGMIFGLEVLTVGRIRFDALVPCFTAAYVGDVVCRGFGIQHQTYLVDNVPVLSMSVWNYVMIAAVVFSAISYLFVEAVHFVKAKSDQYIGQRWQRPVIGAMTIIGLTYIVGTTDYLGLSLPLMLRCFTFQQVALGAFALKLVFTAVTLGTGFKGGEVTPLFCIGTTAGAALAQISHQSVPFFAALGFVSVFAGAANTPVTGIILGMELFGSRLGVPMAAVCIASFILPGHRGIYQSQRLPNPSN